jgi:hypothetical protein
MPVKPIKIVVTLLIMLVLVSAAGIALLWPALTYHDQPGTGLVYRQLAHLNSFTQNHVQIDINLEQNQAGQTYVAATYKPLDATFHLYSKDLPPNGIDGVGRPTLLEVRKGAQAAGSVMDSVPATDTKIDGFDVPFPLYPDGPVTLRLPIKAIEGGNAPMELSLTYMACSLTGGCYPPVLDKTVTVSGITAANNP